MCAREERRPIAGRSEHMSEMRRSSFVRLVVFCLSRSSSMRASLTVASSSTTRS